MKTLKLLIPLLLMTALILSSSGVGFSHPVEQEDLLATLMKTTADQATVAYHSETGSVRFIGSSPDLPLLETQSLQQEISAEQASMEFLEIYGSLFGLNDPQNELTLMKTTQGEREHSYVRYQQVYQGIPVLAGELIVASRPDRAILSVTGEVLPNLQVNVQPRISAQAAAETALSVATSEHNLPAELLVTSQPELWIYNPALLGGPGMRMNTLVWRIEVTPRELLPVNELVLVDAQLGTIPLHFNQIDTAMYRLVYDNNNTRGLDLRANLVLSEGMSTIGIKDADEAYQYAGDTYAFFNKYHKRDSIDNLGMQVISTVRYCPSTGGCPYENAFWDGEQMVYGQGYASADDVVAHELTHGITSYTSNLFYYMQSGAINEALSDIWGEFVDQSNMRGNDSDTVNWLMGEDLPGNAIRSMSNPTAFGDPDRMTSSYYYCGQADNGGVHWNSGVANKAAFLMAQGGTFNGKVVTGIGIPKASAIWYEAATNMVTAGGDYNDLYNSLQSACSVLSSSVSAQSTITAPERPTFATTFKLFLPVSGRGYRQNGITGSDCAQVKNALDAVEMYAQNAGCRAVDAPMCAAGQQPSQLFSDNLENPYLGNWSTVAGSNWYYPQTNNPYQFNATYSSSGKHNFWAYNPDTAGDYAISMNNNVTLPGSGTAFLHFKHAYGFDNHFNSFDGGVVEYSTNGGATWQDVGGFTMDNGYNGTISNSSSNHPLQGRTAFTGESFGYGSTRINLSSLTGQNVRFRFRIGTDSWNDETYRAYGHIGWFVDDISVYTCTASPVTPTPVTPTPVTPTPVTPTPVTPTPVTPTPPPSGPKPGWWLDYLWEEVDFYVTPDGTKIQNMALAFYVDGCGSFVVTRNDLIPISSNEFSFSGEFYGSGYFDDNQSAYVTVGLDNLYVPACETSVSIEPWEYYVEWVDSSQPTTANPTTPLQVERVPEDQ